MNKSEVEKKLQSDYQKSLETKEKMSNINVEEAVSSAGFVLHGYCSKCNRWHRHNSKIGQKHWEYCHIRGGRIK